MKLEKDIKTDMVFEYLYNGIISGELQFGQMLTEREIVSKLGVSRTPVREALRRLEKFGLVETEPHKGVKVITITKQRVIDLYRFREVLEGLGAKLIAETRDKKVIDKLKVFLDDAEKAIELGDIKELSKINNEFHMEIAKTANNSYLFSAIKTLQSHIHLVMTTTLSNKKRPLENIKEHKLILDAILSWDPEFAEAVMKAHVRKSYKTALKEFGLTEQ
ncbi:GntR family transcriptional regulator [Metallumcola ferriviriculae]|uniref:GntR family transcriptional regulator n=1 Tax=Metallumcola ferriviriculae TaxID=3039180 RepID=A0AAU0UJR8_9FIRM|nr:GntR family transcriptional regulator [Desulfitibacteraceae bacterium MK1]